MVLVKRFRHRNAGVDIESADGQVPVIVTGQLDDGEVPFVPDEPGGGHLGVGTGPFAGGLVDVDHVVEKSMVPVMDLGIGPRALGPEENACGQQNNEGKSHSHRLPSDEPGIWDGIRGAMAGGASDSSWALETICAPSAPGVNHNLIFRSRTPGWVATSSIR